MVNINLDNYLDNQSDVIEIIEDYITLQGINFEIARIIENIELKVKEKENIYYAHTSEFDYQTTNIFDLIRMYNDLSQAEKEDIIIMVNGEKCCYFD